MAGILGNVNSTEHFRGVVWPRGASKAADGVTVYRYIVVGMLVTTEKLDVDSSETTVDGPVAGIGSALESARRVVVGRRLGDANSVLLSLSRAWPE